MELFKNWVHFISQQPTAYIVLEKTSSDQYKVFQSFTDHSPTLTNMLNKLGEQPVVFSQITSYAEEQIFAVNLSYELNSRAFILLDIQQLQNMSINSEALQYQLQSLASYFNMNKKLRDNCLHFCWQVYNSLSESQRDWVGTYWRESFLTGQESPDLLVGPYLGPVTPHTRIPIDQGICGLAVREEKTFNIKNVLEDPNFLACSTSTRSEIVIPIRDKNQVVVGELDIDSNQLDQYDSETQKKLELLCLEFQSNCL